MRCHFDSWQHLLSNFIIEVDGDTARSRPECLNFPQGRDDNDKLFTVKAGCHYLDELVKRNGQWRIRKRYLVVTWMNSPGAVCAGALLEHSLPFARG